MNFPLKIKEIKTYRHVRHENDYVFGGHSHGDSEVNVVLKGSFHVTYDDTVYTLKENMLFIYEPDVFHHSRVVSHESAEVFTFRFTSESNAMGAGIYAFSSLNLNLAHILMEEVEKNAVKKNEDIVLADNFAEEAKSFLELFLYRVVSDDRIPTLHENSDEILFRHAISYMKENIGENLTIEEIAKAVGTNQTKLKRVFRNFTGMGVIQHFSAMKITASKILLRENLSILEISEKLGYSSQGYMSLCFKKETGMSPLQYRKSLL